MISCLLLVLFVWNSSFNGVFSANILIAYELPSPSHQLWNYALAEGLIERGHNITMVGPCTHKRNGSERYHPLVFEGVLEAVTSDYSAADTFANIDPLTSLLVCMDFVYTVCNHSYHTNGFKTLMNYPKEFKFDLIIIDVTTSPCLYPFIQKFNYPPTIGVTAFLLPPFLSEIFGNDLHPSYLPFFHVKYTDNMNFAQRVVNYVFSHLDTILKNWYETKNIEKLAKEKFGEDMDSLKSLERRISMLLCNIHEAINFPQPLPPNIIPVGGLHVKPSKSLPKDLQTVMDNAKEGVIFFCLGTNVRSDRLNAETRKVLLTTFAKLKQTVIWKFESKLDNAPDNVIIREWLPQNDILGHPSLKLFISHGGALSTMEAIYHGIPIIGMPFFMDQTASVRHMVERKLALQMDFFNITSQNLMENIEEILYNPVYSTNMKELSRRMRDQPQTPLERAVFWTEYAIRHNGAQFLNPKSRDMSLFVSSSTDVVLFLTLITLLCVYALFVICKRTRAYLGYKLRKKEKRN